MEKLTPRMLLISNMFPSRECSEYAVFVKNFMQQMELEGFAVRCIVIEGRGFGFIDKLMKNFRFFINVVAAIRKNDFDLVYVHNINQSLLPLYFSKRDKRKPLIVNAHGGDVIPVSSLGPIIQKIVAPIIKSANLVVVPSNYFKALVKEKFKLKDENIFVSPSGGINAELFKPQDCEIRPWKEFDIGYISRIDRGKGWDIFLLAMSHLVQEGNKEISAIMIGEGGQVSDLKEMILSLGLERHVHYLGAMEQVELAHYINKMGIFVFPTKLNESLGLVGLEAMACGVPVIGANIGGLREYIKDGFNGSLFEPGNYLELAMLIEKYLLMDEMTIQKLFFNAIESARPYNAKEVSSAMAIRIRDELVLKPQRVSLCKVSKK